MATGTTEPGTAADRARGAVKQGRSAREKEYGQFVCTTPIDMSHVAIFDDDGVDTGEREWVVGVGSRAFNPGDPVPASTVRNLHLDTLGMVAPTPPEADVQLGAPNDAPPSAPSAAEGTAAKVASALADADTNGGGN